jgi:hypothetical protein
LRCVSDIDVGAKALRANRARQVKRRHAVADFTACFVNLDHRDTAGAALHTLGAPGDLVLGRQLRYKRRALLRVRHRSRRKPR